MDKSVATKLLDDAELRIASAARAIASTDAALQRARMVLDNAPKPHDAVAEEVSEPQSNAVDGQTG